MSLGLPIQIDKDSTKPIYVQLYEELRNYIVNGILAEDYKLPPIRSMAEELHVNNVTIVNAYRLLEDNKLVYKKTGSGTYVMPLKDKIILESDIPLVSEEIEYEMDKDIGDGTINFASATPDPMLFPVSDFKQVLNEVLERDGGNAFMYQDSKGYAPLRDAIASYVLKYGINAAFEDIHIISGAQQGIDIISKVLLTNGDYVFVECPTYMGAIAVFKSRGANIIEIPMQNDGPDMKALEKMLKLIKPKFFYTMPVFQNPTGTSYSERKKRHLLLLCKKYDIRIVEDDYLSDLCYLDNNILPLKAYDTEDRVLYIKSFSKIFMPGLRVAYMIIPQNIREKVMSAKHMTDISTSGFMQRILDVYMTRNIWDKHIAYMKKEYGLRYIEAVRAVKKYLRGVSFNQPNGGLNLWLRLPEEVLASKLFEQCRKEKVLITPGTTFLKDREGERYIRISFAGIGPAKITEGISIIGQKIEAIRNNRR